METAILDAETPLVVWGAGVAQALFKDDSGRVPRNAEDADGMGNESRNTMQCGPSRLLQRPVQRLSSVYHRRVITLDYFRALI